MRIAFFSTKPYDERFMQAANGQHELTFFEVRLLGETAVLAKGFDAVCVFVNDVVDAGVLEQLAVGGVRLVALRCAGFNNVDLTAAARHNIPVVRVPAYSPYAVAEHALALVLALNRQIHRAYCRVREGNFSLDGLMGFDLHGQTAGVVGTGKIGELLAGMLQALGCRVVAFDPKPNPAVVEKGIAYVSLDELLSTSRIISLHCPLLPSTRQLINERTLRQMQPGTMLINTSRGELVDTRAVINALKNGTLGYLGLDVYEEEADTFFEDCSDRGVQDDVLARLLTFPNVIVTGHQGFFTRNALENIAATTVANLDAFAAGAPLVNQVKR